jgi:transcriptional regulator
MYIPKSFAEDDITKLHALMRDYNFAVLVTAQANGVSLATHLPFLLASERGPYGTLLCHFARANPHWRGLDETREALVIFQGPHAYVSPSWYEEPLSVPTWNYAIVHAYGRPRIIEDTTALYTMLRELTQQSEARFERPWPFALPDDFVQQKMRGIVGIEIEITRLEGKFKLSQNRSVGDQERVAATLLESADDLSVGVAELMQERKGS